MTNTTNTKEHTEQKEKPKATPFLEELSVRDYFAAKAMPIAATFYDTSDEVCNEAAAWCYKMADAMLEARK